MNPYSLLDRSRQSLSEFWTLRNARERAMLAAAVLVVTIALVFALLFEPALSGRERLNRNLPELRRQVAQMQALSKEAAVLSAKSASGISGTSAAPYIAMTKQNIDEALARNGLKAQSVILAGDSAKVQLAAVSFTGTLNWLDGMQKNARLSVAEASIIALDQPDMIDATITLHQQRNE